MSSSRASLPRRPARTWVVATTTAIVRSVAIVAALATATGQAGAHDGPPYPIVVDRIAGPYRLSVWADPDVGTGTFLLFLEPATDSPLASDCRVEIGTRAARGDTTWAWHSAERRPDRKAARAFEGRVPFDAAGPWLVRFRMASAAGHAAIESQVEVTPPGQGPILDFVLYGFPFVAVAFLFLKAALRRRTNAER